MLTPPGPASHTTATHRAADSLAQTASCQSATTRLSRVSYTPNARLHAARSKSGGSHVETEDAIILQR
jgi:hypothetical protein